MSDKVDFTVVTYKLESENAEEDQAYVKVYLKGRLQVDKLNERAQEVVDKALTTEPEEFSWTKAQVRQ